MLILGSSQLSPESQDEPFFNNLACESIRQVDITLLYITYINKGNVTYIYKCDVYLHSPFDYFLSLVDFYPIKQKVI